jgi:hypothetical protein
MSDTSSWSSPLTEQPRTRACGRAVGLVLLAAVLLPLVYLMGPSTLVDCTPDNLFDRFGTWVGQGAHVDGPGGSRSCRAPHPVTWATMAVTTTACVALAVHSLRRG